MGWQDQQGMGVQQGAMGGNMGLRNGTGGGDPLMPPGAANRMGYDGMGMGRRTMPGQMPTGGGDPMVPQGNMPGETPKMAPGPLFRPPLPSGGVDNSDGRRPMPQPGAGPDGQPMPMNSATNAGNVPDAARMGMNGQPTGYKSPDADGMNPLLGATTGLPGIPQQDQVGQPTLTGEQLPPWDAQKLGLFKPGLGRRMG